MVEHNEINKFKTDVVGGLNVCRCSRTYAVDPRCCYAANVIGYQILAHSWREVEFLPSSVHLFALRH